ncbi:MAG: zinc ribbon domain-containing protein [Dehalococcoidales bacterium]|nr:zinc ribbon domain-containing protein [Dehalococcoidales bacterium]
MFCRQCGKELETGSKFCDECGIPVVEDITTPVITEAKASTTRVEVPREKEGGKTKLGKAEKSNEHVDTAFKAYLDSVRKRSNDNVVIAMWSSWAQGAYLLFQRTGEMPEFQFTPDNLQKAKQLVNHYMQPMFSAWFRNWLSQNQYTEQQQEAIRITEFQNIQSLLNIEDKDLITLHMGLDTELNMVLNKNREGAWYYTGLFHQRYLECVTGETIVDWAALQFPIRFYMDVISHSDQNRFKGLSVSGSLSLYLAIVESVNHMFSEFNRMSEKGSS